MNGKTMRTEYLLTTHGDALDGAVRGNTLMTTVPDYRLDPPKRPGYPTCPWCGTSMYDWLVEDVCGDIVGCSECTKTISAEEYLEVLDED